MRPKGLIDSVLAELPFSKKESRVITLQKRQRFQVCITRLIVSLDEFLEYDYKVISKNTCTKKDKAILLLIMAIGILVKDLLDLDSLYENKSLERTLICYECSTYFQEARALLVTNVEEYAKAYYGDDFGIFLQETIAISKALKDYYSIISI